MSEASDPDSIRSKRFLRLAIVSAFLLAFFWPLGKFFFWIFAGATTYFAFLAVYYRPRPVQASRSYQTQSRSDRFTTASSADVKSKIKIIAIVVGGIIFFILFLLMVIGFIVGNDNSPESPPSESAELPDRAALDSNPNDIDALTNVGNQFYSIGQYDSAMAYYDRVLRIDQQNSSAMFNKSLVYYQLKNYSKSMEWSRKCVSLHPENADAYTLVGDNYYAQQNNTEALSWYRQAYDKGANNPELLNMMAYLYDQQNNRSEAIRLYKETLQQDSSLVAIYERLAELEPGNAARYQALANRWK